MAMLGIRWLGTGSAATAWSDLLAAPVAWVRSFVRNSAPTERTTGATGLKRRVPANPERGRPMLLNWPAKDPGETLDYGIDWTPRELGGDTLISVDHSVAGDVTFVRGEVDPSGLSTSTWLSGGTNGTTSTVLVTARTQSGRVMIERVAIKVRAR